MSRIFLSHSSKDDFAAVAIRDWLAEEGWDDVFLDLDPARGIRPGEHWERALHENAARCEAVLFLVSRNWLNSDWCRSEFELARRLNKRVFIAPIEDLPIVELPAYLTATFQAVPLASGEDHRLFRVVRPGTHEERHVTFSREGLARLKAGLVQAGLDPRFFAWPPEGDPERAPYRGLEPMEAADAGVFFGRDGPIVEALDALRGLRESATPRLFVILGASGAGKSSFLRAGLLPRLARDDANFLCLKPVRPERAIINGPNGFVNALTTAATTYGVKATRANLREAAAKGVEALRPFLRALAARSDATKPPTLVLAIDQAEELFAAEGLREGEAFLRLLHDLTVVDDPAMIAIFAIRSDSYDALERARPLEGLKQRPFSLLPMPRGAYQTVIERPTERLAQAGKRFDMDPGLTQALLADIETGGGGDSLPLLAFTLEQLYLNYNDGRRLSRAEYESFGGLAGAIEAAMARVFLAADADGRIPRDSEARLTLLRRGLIPWLAGVDPESRTPRRRVARAAQIPEEARSLIDLLVEQRLLTRDVDRETGETTIEPAHEALLRQWGRLQDWLQEDFALLAALEGVKRAARDWDANAKAEAWLAHQAQRLAEAQALDARPDIAAKLDSADRAYLAACRAREDAARAEAEQRRLEREEEQARRVTDAQELAATERKAARRTRLGLAAASLLALIAGAAAIWAFEEAKTANLSEKEARAATRTTAQRSAVLAANTAKQLSDGGAIDAALLLMLDGARWFDDASAPEEIRFAMYQAVDQATRTTQIPMFPNMRAFEATAALVLVNDGTNDILAISDKLPGKRLVAGASGDSPILAIGENQAKDSLVVVRKSLEVELIRVADGARKTFGKFPTISSVSESDYWAPDSVDISADLVIRMFWAKNSDTKPDGAAQILDLRTGQFLDAPMPRGNGVFLRGPKGDIFAYDEQNNSLLTLVPKGRGFTTKLAPKGALSPFELRYGNCATGKATAWRDVAMTALKSADGFENSFACRQYGDSLLLTHDFATADGGDTYEFAIIDQGSFAATGPEVRDPVKETVGSAQGAGSFNTGWVGLDPKSSSYAVTDNRAVYARPENTTDDQPLATKHTSIPSMGRFLTSEDLLIVDDQAGVLVLHDLRRKPSKPHSFYSDLPPPKSAEPAAVAPLNHSNCASDGGAMSRTETTFDGWSANYGDAANAIKLSKGSESLNIDLGFSALCLTFSKDWKRLLVVPKDDAGDDRKNKVFIYDFDKARSARKLEGAAIGELSVAKPATAFFAGESYDVVTANSTDRVLRWSFVDGAWRSREVYHRDEASVFYAEPDRSGDDLLVVEMMRGGLTDSLYYSVAFQQPWRDFGVNSYGLFNRGGDIVMNPEIDGMSVPTLSQLVKLAEENLSPRCAPTPAADYRSSPCWPPSYK